MNSEKQRQGRKTERIFKLIYGDMTALTLAGRDKKEVEIEPLISLYFNAENIDDPNNGNLSVYAVNVKEGKKTRIFKKRESLKKFLINCGLDDGDITKAGNFPGLKEYEENAAFNALDMEGILKRYPEADILEMVAPAGAADDIDAMEEEIRSRALSAIKDVLEQLGEKEREKLPSPEEFFISACADKERLKEKESPFLCDNVEKGGTTYYSPRGALWHMYSAVDMYFEGLDALARGEKAADALEKEKPLIPFLISRRQAFSWHCTSSSQPYDIFRFRLTGEVKKWLLKHKSDYDFSLDGLQDMSLYKGDKILFSSCTHERFHNDLTE